MGFQNLGDFGHPRHPAIRTTGLLTFAPAGLSPAEHTSFHWSLHPIPDMLHDFLGVAVPTVDPSQSLTIIWPHGNVSRGTAIAPGERS